MLARHVEHAENASNPFSHRLRKAPILGDIRYRRAAGGPSRRSVCDFVCAGSCRIRCAWLDSASATPPAERAIFSLFFFVIAGNKYMS